MFPSIKTLALNKTFRTGPWGRAVTHSQPGRGRAAGRTRKHARCRNEGPPELPLKAQGAQSHHNFQSLSKSLVPLLKKQKNKASLVMGLQCSLTGDGPAESGPLLLGLHLLPRRQLLQLQRKASAWVTLTLPVHSTSYLFNNLASPAGSSRTIIVEGQKKSRFRPRRLWVDKMPAHNKWGKM